MAYFNWEHFVPDLQAALREPPFDPKKLLHVAIRVKDPGEEKRLQPAPFNRSELWLNDGQNNWNWNTLSIRGLFRGDKVPPVLGSHPEAYNDAFLLMDLHVLEISRAFGDLRDAELLEIFSALRRRPDGRSLSFTHDYLWQAAALILATRPLSQLEFEAIMARLERSARTFEMGPSSRNLVASLHQTLGQAI